MNFKINFLLLLYIFITKCTVIGSFTCSPRTHLNYKLAIPFLVAILKENKRSPHRNCLHDPLWAERQRFVALSNNLKAK